MSNSHAVLTLAANQILADAIGDVDTHAGIANDMHDALFEVLQTAIERHRALIVVEAVETARKLRPNAIDEEIVGIARLSLALQVGEDNAEALEACIEELEDGRHL